MVAAPPIWNSSAATGVTMQAIQEFVTKMCSQPKDLNQHDANGSDNGNDIVVHFSGKSCKQFEKQRNCIHVNQAHKKKKLESKGLNAQHKVLEKQQQGLPQVPRWLQKTGAQAHLKVC